jgi:hypothetical protein
MKLIINWNAECQLFTLMLSVVGASIEMPNATAPENDLYLIQECRHFLLFICFECNQIFTES